MSTGYDTARIVWRQSVPIDDPVGGWQSHKVDDVKCHTTAYLNVPGMQATGVEFADGRSELVVQCSLPKLLWGQNIDTLGPESVGAAVDRLDALVHRYWPSSPEVLLWGVRRVDCTANRVYTGEHPEESVGLVLEALKKVKLHGRYPRIGDSGTSVSWHAISGGLHRKAYSKYFETGEERARGILRVEVGAQGVAASRRVLGLEGGTSVRFHDVLEDRGFPDRCTAGFGKVVGFVADQVEKQPFMRVFWRFKKHAERSMNLKGGGSGKAAAWLGYAWMVSQAGWAALNLPPMTEYRIRRVFREAGVDPAMIDWGTFDPGGVLEDMDPVGQGALELAAEKVYGVRAGNGKA